MRIPNMGIWFLAQTSSIFCPIWMKIHIRVPETTSYKWSTHNLDLCMLSGFGIIGCTTGTGGGLGFKIPWPQVLFCRSTANSKTRFTKKNYGEPAHLNRIFLQTQIIGRIKGARLRGSEK